jgi:hypothetical protein
MVRRAERLPVLDGCHAVGAISDARMNSALLKNCFPSAPNWVSPGLIKLARAAFPRPRELVVLVRPRGGDFVYTEQEMEVMREDILAAHSLGADGVAIGCLDAAG